MFSTNVRPKTKKIVRAVFWEKYRSIWFWANFRPFCEYLQIENFFQKSGSVTFYLYSPLTSCKKWEKSLEPFLRKLRYKPTNQPTNQLLPVTPILKDLADTGLKSPGWHQSKNPICQIPIEILEYYVTANSSYQNFKIISKLQR